MTDTPRRIEVLDVLRGVAILGTLGLNIWLFTNPLGPAAALSVMSAPLDSLGGAVEGVLRTLANGKFLCLLSLLFGMGLELQYRSAQRRGRRWPGWYLWRTALLLIEGALHYVLVFEWDVLMSYAVASFVVAYLVGRSDRAVRAWIWVLAALHVSAMGLVTAAMLQTPSTGSGATVSNQPGLLFAEGSYPAQVANRLDDVLLYRLEALFIVPMSIALFLLGSRLMRAGVFDNSARGSRLRTRLMALGLGVALPLNLLTSFAGPAWFFVTRYVLPPLVALGLLGLITALAHRMTAAPGLLRRGFTSVGRAALSCYVFQNLLASILCYGWGLGLAEQLQEFQPWWVLGAWTGISALMMVLATRWLRRHSRGPLELAWHWAYRAPQRLAHSRAHAAS